MKLVVNEKYKTKSSESDLKKQLQSICEDAKKIQDNAEKVLKNTEHEITTHFNLNASSSLKENYKLLNIHRDPLHQGTMINVKSKTAKDIFYKGEALSESIQWEYIVAKSIIRDAQVLMNGINASTFKESSIAELSKYTNKLKVKHSDSKDRINKFIKKHDALPDKEKEKMESKKQYQQVGNFIKNGREMTLPKYESDLNLQVTQPVETQTLDKKNKDKKPKKSKKKSVIHSNNQQEKQPATQTNSEEEAKAYDYGHTKADLYIAHIPSVLPIDVCSQFDFQHHNKDMISGALKQKIQLEIEEILSEILPNLNDTQKKILSDIQDINPFITNLTGFCHRGISYNLTLDIGYQNAGITQIYYQCLDIKSLSSRGYNIFSNTLPVCNDELLKNKESRKEQIMLLIYKEIALNATLEQVEALIQENTNKETKGMESIKEQPIPEIDDSWHVVPINEHNEYCQFLEQLRNEKSLNNNSANVI